MRPTTTAEPVSDLRLSRSHPGAFERFYQSHADGVLRFLARRTLEVEVARDLTAETFAQAFRARRRFRGSTEEEAAAWLYAIARNLLSRYLRTGAVERKATERLGIALSTLTEADHERVVQLAGLAELRTAVAAEFERLVPDQRDALQLRVVEELPYPEVAARLAISEPTARARVSRGLRQMAAALDAFPTAKETMT
jgi:RNA polymerase sigma-70 factor (ECF subfamily)